jgi:hypothetical protein
MVEPEFKFRGLQENLCAAFQPQRLKPHQSLPPAARVEAAAFKKAPPGASFFFQTASRGRLSHRMSEFCF